MSAEDRRTENRIMSLCQEGRLSEALSLGKMHLDAAIKAHGENDPRVAYALQNLTGIYRQLN